jgi:hypothetical protein
MAVLGNGHPNKSPAGHRGRNGQLMRDADDISETPQGRSAGSNDRRYTSDNEVTMKSVSKGRPGRQPMTEKRREYVKLIRQGVSNSKACRDLGIDRKTGHWWKNGGVVTRHGVTRFVEPIIDQRSGAVESRRYLTEGERIRIADGVRAGRSTRSIALELGRAVSTISRELDRNRSAGGEYLHHAAHALMLAPTTSPEATTARGRRRATQACAALPRSTLEPRAGSLTSCLYRRTRVSMIADRGFQ